MDGSTYGPPASNQQNCRRFLPLPSSLFGLPKITLSSAHPDGDWSLTAPTSDQGPGSGPGVGHPRESQGLRIQFVCHGVAVVRPSRLSLSMSLRRGGEGTDAVKRPVRWNGRLECHNGQPTRTLTNPGCSGDPQALSA